MPQSDAHISLPDEELLYAYRRSGDNHWLGILLQRYTVLLLGVAMKYLKDKELAQDAVQQVFLKSLTRLPEGEIQNFKGWLYILMRNHCLQQLRDRTFHAPEEALNYVPQPEGASREEHELKEMTLAQMQEALSELGPEQRTCVVRFYLEKKSYQQIMEQTGFTFAQVKSHIQNGKRNLKLILLKKNGNKEA